MGFRVCDPLGTHEEFIGLGLLRKEHLYKGPRTGQEDGTLHAPFFPAPTCYNTKSLAARSPPTPVSSTRLGFASLSPDHGNAWFPSPLWCPLWAQHSYPLWSRHRPRCSLPLPLSRRNLPHRVPLSPTAPLANPPRVPVSLAKRICPPPPPVFHYPRSELHWSPGGWTPH